MSAVAERSFTLIRGSNDGTKLTLGDDVAAYLQFKRKKVSDKSYRGYAAALHAMVGYFPPEITIDVFEGPAGTRRIETFLADQWGEVTGRTYNKNLSIVRGFFGWAADRERLLRDPTRLMEKAKEKQFHRRWFNDVEHDQILAANPEPRDWLALRLLLDFGIRKGALQNIRFQDFDHAAQRLVIFTKGDTIHGFPIPEDRFWDVLASHIVDIDAQPTHYLLPRYERKQIRPAGKKQIAALALGLDQQIAMAEEVAEILGSRQARATVAHLQATRELIRLTLDAATEKITWFPELQIGDHGAHSWWYRCLSRAGIVEPGTTAGTRMHTARHTAAQRMLERTGNAKNSQKLLGHTNSATTETYLGWDESQLEAALKKVLNG